MGLINKTTLNFIVKQGEKLVESSLVRKPNITNVEGLRYMPQQLSTDVVEISQKALQSTKTALEPATLQELVNKGLSLNEIASELGVKVGKVRCYLAKYNIISDAQKEFRILKRYFTATTKEEKSKAFEEIDKYLQQIAKEELKQKKGSTYEDCLQDIRLRFFEIAEKSKQDGISFPYRILKTIQETRPVIKQEIKTVGLSKADLKAADSGIELFETKDYEDYLWKYAHRHLRGREAYSLEQYLCEDKTIKEIAEYFWLTPKRAKDIIKSALSKLRQQLEPAKQGDFEAERIKFSQ
jgi:DNA-directed RNA polymerase specialized sigma24 family protein